MGEVGIPGGGNAIPQMLKSFRDNDTITLQGMNDDQLAALSGLYRITEIRELFTPPGQEFSSTDSDEDARAVILAQANNQDLPVASFDGLPEALQAVIAGFASNTNKQHQDLEFVRARLGLAANPNPPAAESTTDDESTTLRADDSSTTTLNPPSSAEKSLPGNNRVDVADLMGEADTEGEADPMEEGAADPKGEADPMEEGAAKQSQKRRKTGDQGAWLRVFS